MTDINKAIERGFAECDTCKAKPGTPILCGGCLRNRETIMVLIAAVKQLQADVSEARAGHRQLDGNWSALHNTSMGAIRAAMAMPDATVPELIEMIEQYKRRVNAFDGLLAACKDQVSVFEEFGHEGGMSKLLEPAIAAAEKAK